MAKFATPRTNFHTLHLRSRILGDIIKELNLNELRITKLVISADKAIEHKTEDLPIPELDKYCHGGTIIRKRFDKRKEIKAFPLRIREDIQEEIRKEHLSNPDGIDLEYIDKILTNPPYDFPYVRIEEFEAEILKAEKAEIPEEREEAEEEIGEAVVKPKPVRIPKKIKFKRTRVKQANIVATLTPQPHAGPKYTLELVTTRRKAPVERIREIIAEHDPIKFCELVMKSDVVTVCKEILEPKGS